MTDELTRRLRRYGTQLDATDSSAQGPRSPVIALDRDRGRSIPLTRIAVAAALVLAVGVAGALTLSDGDVTVGVAGPEPTGGLSAPRPSGPTGELAAPSTTVSEAPTSVAPTSHPPTSASLPSTSSSPATSAPSSSAGEPATTSSLPTTVPGPVDPVDPVDPGDGPDTTTTTTEPPPETTVRSLPAPTTTTTVKPPDPPPTTIVNPNARPLTVTEVRPGVPAAVVSVPRRTPATDEFAAQIELVVRTANPAVVELLVRGRNGCTGPASFELVENADRIEVAVQVRDNNTIPDTYCSMQLVPFLVSITLDRPLGTRPIFDVGVLTGG